MSEMKIRDVSFLFSILMKFVSNILILPQSLANVERLFRRVDLNKI